MRKKTLAVEGMKTLYKRRGVSSVLEVQQSAHKVDGCTAGFIIFDTLDDKLMQQVCEDADKHNVVLQISANPRDNYGYRDVRTWLTTYGFTGIRIMTRHKVKESLNA